MLKAKNLPDEILQRHYDAVSQYEADYAKLQMYIQNCAIAESLLDQQSAMDELDGFLQEQKFKRTHQTDDPNNLPFGTPNADDTREPVTDSQQLSRLINSENEARWAEKVLDVFISSAHAAGPTSDDLAETIDVQLTDAIRAKAQELNNNPVEIYNWVRNTIEFLPTYGSIQGADYTLQMLSGNPFDTASLLIALLRASNIPARYAYGTVRIPVDQVMNWVGGVEVPGAAQQLLGQGGIPNIGLVNGGIITHIKIEHIWAEAWVDFEPSRGAKNIQGDSWVPLDASFKQYEYTQGEDLANSVPFDGESLLESIVQNATVNETDGYIQGINQSTIENDFIAYQTQIEAYINSRNTDPTVGDVLGTKLIIAHESRILASGLPYELVTRTNNFSTIPDNLRHKFRYTLGTELFGTEGSRLISFERSLPELAGKQLALSFKPATQADEDLINSFLPVPDPNDSEVPPEQFPDILPGYLIGLVAEFSQDDAVIYSAAAGTMGSELYETLALWSPAQGWQQAVNHPTAGEFRAIGLDLQGINKEEAARLQSNVEETKAKLDSADESQLATLTKRHMIGDLLHATIYNYLALNDVEDHVQSSLAGVINYRMPSYGIFSTFSLTNYFFGVPHSVSPAGLVMDVDHLATQTTTKDNDRERSADFVRASGMRASALEHQVPEQVFSTAEAPAQGISAVKALTLAGAEGQKIWRIDQGNLSIALASINLGFDIEAEIRNAVNAGKIATVHENPINFAGSSAIGYLLIDPETGGGAYKISRGGNGGFLDLLYDSMIYLASAVSGFADGYRGTGANQAFLKTFKWLGNAALGVGLFFTGLSIFSNDALGFWDQVGQFSVNLLGVAAAAAVGLALGAALIPAAVSATIALVSALVIAYAFNTLAVLLFSWYRPHYRYRDEYEAYA